MPERKIGFKRFAPEVVQFVGDTLMAPISLAKLIREGGETITMLLGMGISSIPSVLFAGLSSISKNPPLGYSLSIIIYFSYLWIGKRNILSKQKDKSNLK